MGNTPHGFQIGDACNTCIPDVFDSGRTPKYIAVQFSGIEKLEDFLPEPPNGHRFILIEYKYCGWEVDVLLGEQACRLSVILDDLSGKTKVIGWFYPELYPFFFHYWQDGVCKISWDSELPDPPPLTKSWYSGGHGDLHWGSAINENSYNAQDLVE